MSEKDEFINKKFVCEPIQDLEGGKVDSVTFTMDIETWNKLKAQIIKENTLARLNNNNLECIFASLTYTVAEQEILANDNIHCKGCVSCKQALKIIEKQLLNREKEAKK